MLLPRKYFYEAEGRVTLHWELNSDWKKQWSKPCINHIETWEKNGDNPHTNSIETWWIWWDPQPNQSTLSHRFWWHKLQRLTQKLECSCLVKLTYPHMNRKWSLQMKGYPSAYSSPTCVPGHTPTYFHDLPTFSTYLLSTCWNI